MNDWQPIATAPKDGSDILLFNGSSQRMQVCSWGYDDLFKSEPKEWIFGESQGEHNEYSVFDNPSHWMPLPPPPPF
jgi:hypothetical protein